MENGRSHTQIAILYGEIRRFLRLVKEILDQPVSQHDNAGGVKMLCNYIPTLENGFASLQ